MAIPSAMPDQKQNMAAHHDACLNAIAQHQDRDAFITIFEDFAPRVKSFLMRGGFNEEKAEELTQEVMINVWQKAQQFDSHKASASTWIFTIARNKKIDIIRKEKRHEIDPNDPCFVDVNVSETKMQDTAFIEQSEAKTVRQAIKKLPKDQAALIQAFYFGGKTHTEIAKDFKIPLGTVKSRLRLAIDKLKKDFAVENE